MRSRRPAGLPSNLHQQGCKHSALTAFWVPAQGIACQAAACDELLVPVHAKGFSPGRCRPAGQPSIPCRTSSTVGRTRWKLLLCMRATAGASTHRFCD